MSHDPWSFESYHEQMNRPSSVVVPDGILRFRIKSRTNPKTDHVVELDGYNGNGICSCPDFQFNLEKHLKRGLTGRQAFEQGKVKLKTFHFNPDDALMCYHLVEAHRELEKMFLERMRAYVAERKRTCERKIA